MNNTLYDALNDVTKDTITIQTICREMLAKDPNSPELLDTIGKYKATQEHYIDALLFDADKATRRKQVNNRINDISRICREVAGQSLVCTSRKNHEYGYVLPKPRARKIEPKQTMTITTADAYKPAHYAGVELPKGVTQDMAKELVDTIIAVNPYTTIAAMFKTHGNEKMKIMLKDHVMYGDDALKEAQKREKLEEELPF